MTRTPEQEALLAEIREEKAEAKRIARNAPNPDVRLQYTRLLTRLIDQEATILKGGGTDTSRTDDAALGACRRQAWIEGFTWAFLAGNPGNWDASEHASLLALANEQYVCWCVDRGYDLVMKEDGNER
jgi:hypothetical protein